MTSGTLMKVRRILLTTTCLAGIAGALSPALADDPSMLWPTTTPGTFPAVSRLNGRIDGAFGAFDDKTAAVFQGSFAAPIGFSYGAQLDVPMGDWGGRDFVGAAGHLFWRDPATALFGLYGIGYYSNAARDIIYDPNTGATNYVYGFDLWRLALEAHLYRDAFTFQARIGAEVFGSTTRFFDEADLVYYATPDLRLTAGHRYVGGLNAGALSAEYQTPLRGVAGFVETIIGERNTQIVLGGIRWYFDNDKSLVRRDREDILPGDLPSDLFALSHEANRSALPFVPPAPPPVTAMP